MTKSGERARQVRTASTIGLVVGGLFSVFNMLTPGMLALGLTELAAVLLLVAPAVVISRTPERVAVAESLLLMSAIVIFGALVVLGGVAGTGLFWVYTMPFLAFFLKGQRQGWVYSLVFLAVLAVYLFGINPKPAWAYPHDPVVAGQFLLAVLFYTLVAAAFNRVRNRYEAQLLQRQANAEAATLAKSRFLAAASHDLRQPAHALGMFVARLTQVPLSRPASELVAGVDASVRALQDMLDTFFDYSRLDAPSLHMQRKPFAVEQLFGPLRTSFMAMAAQKGLRLHIRPSHLWVDSDAVLLHRVLLNLVGNAVQHTPSGSILVACRPDAAANSVRFEIWDSGVGIAPEHHQKVFEEFFQIDNPERDRSKGIGLGLSLVQRACSLLGHPLTLRSALGCGTRISVTVPKAQAVLAPPTAALAEPSGLAKPVGLHVLLIEDDVLGSAALQGLLHAWGCQVTTVDQAQTACEAAQGLPKLDFILSDYRLRGDHHGVQAVQMVRHALGREVPACVISGDIAQDVRDLVQAAGLVLLQKPVRPAKLRSVLRQLTSG